MKKTLLAAATLSALMASGMANAAFTDADGSGGWTDSLEFNGTITNTNPAWKYQIPETAIAAAKNWDVERVNGTVDGSNTNFSFAKNLTVLEGAMKVPAPNGGAGLQPIISFGEGSNKVEWDTTRPGTVVTLKVNAKKGTAQAGELFMTLEAQAAAVKIIGNDRPNDIHYTNVPDAYQLLQQQSYWPINYADKTPTPDWGSYESTVELSNTKAQQVSAALLVKAKNFKLSVPTTSIPDAWTATLPISITVK